MAQIIQQELVITISKLVKDTEDFDPAPNFVSDEVKDTLINAVETLLADDSLVIEAKG